MSRPYFSLKTLELEATAQKDLTGVLQELAFRTSRAAKRLLSALGNPATPSPVPAETPQREAKKPASRINLEALKAKIERLRKQVQACHGERLSNTAKRLAQTMHKRLEGDRYKRQADILEAVCEALDQFPGLTTSEIIAKSQEASLFECQMISNGYHSYNVETRKPRHAETIHETLRGLLDPEKAKKEDFKAQQIQAEASLRQSNLPGFFPTPPSVIEIMLEQAGDLRGKCILEPSCGKGDLIQAALKAGAAKVKAFEIVPKLADYCSKFVIPEQGQALTIENADFLESPSWPADVVLMNPPFERDAAPKHVQHALKSLKDGGRLVAVMPGNWAQKATGELLINEIERAGYEMLDIEIESGSFAGAEAFRQTGVNTTLLVITK